MARKTFYPRYKRTIIKFYKDFERDDVFLFAVYLRTF